MSYDYWGRNRFTQAEKKQEVLRDTFHSRAEADANLLAQGRFKKETETRVIGSGTPTYPQIPSGPWSVGDPGAPDAATDQLGYDINAVEPVLEQPTPDPDDSLVHAVSVEGEGQRGSRRSSPSSASSQPSPRKSFRRF